jgi:hypothetical protein
VLLLLLFLFLFLLLLVVVVGDDGFHNTLCYVLVHIIIVLEREEKHFSYGGREGAFVFFVCE